MRTSLGGALRSCLLAGLTASASAAAPVANDDAYTTAINQALVVNAPGVLANDTDADVGDTLTAAPSAAPLNGTLALQPSGAFTYTPDAGFYGTDSFSYEASDGVSSDTGVVTVTIPYDGGAYGGGGGGGGYGGGGALAPALLALLAVLAFYPRGLKRSKRRCISP